MHVKSQGHSPKQFPLSFLLHCTWKEIDKKKCFLSDSQERLSCQHFLIKAVLWARKQLPQCGLECGDYGQGAPGATCVPTPNKLLTGTCLPGKQNLISPGDSTQLHSSLLHLLPEINSQVVLNASFCWGFFFFLFTASVCCLMYHKQFISLLSLSHTHTKSSILKRWH